MVGHQARLRAGVATVDITPDDPVVMGGYGNRDGKSTGVNDPLYSTALVLEDGTTTVAIVSIDVLNVSREFTARIRRTLDGLDVDVDEVILAATHTHAGPYIPARALDVSPVLRVDDDVTDVETAITQGVARSIANAAERLTPAAVRVGQTSIPEVVQNRRAAGGVSGNVRVPHGPIDPDLVALVVEFDDRPPAVLYHVACHPVCTTGSERLLSADWPGYTRSYLQNERDAAVLFVNGAAGDINPVGRTADRTDPPVYEFMAEIGSAVAEGVLTAIENAESKEVGVRHAPIRVDSQTRRLPVKRTPDVDVIEKRIAEFRSTMDRIGDSDAIGHGMVKWRLRHAEELLAIARWDATALPTRFPYVEIGEVGIIGLPGEFHARHGLELKRRSTVRTLLPAGYVNDYVGYVPTLDDLEHVGYEVRTMKIAPDAIVASREATRELVSDPS